jgi:Phage tail assembly chaperone proteins, E, or 41 or 14
MDDRTNASIAEFYDDGELNKHKLKPPEAAPQPADEPAVDFQSTAEGLPPQEEEDNPLEHVLTTPIEAHGEMISVLKWREPTARDIERAGNPIIVDFFGDKPQLTFAEKKMSAMISLLAQIPPHSVGKMSAGDWNAIAWKMTRFFMPRMGPISAPKPS